MTRLNSDHILKERQNHDADVVSALVLSHKALSDVSCLSDFKNLERLDLSFNNLSSLEGLKTCVNLKWLSVSQNKLESLRGVEGLSKLTVLNAGKNKVKSMNEVRSLVSLRALILNDNEIASICRLDQMKNINTIVLSRNPVSEIGDSLAKVRTISKLSLSKCQLQTVGSSLKSCSELKELRLAHNDIKTLPAELAHNTKLQNLDLGNNLITSWLDLKVLASLPNLKNLNLQGNPVVEKVKLVQKVKKLAPNLQTFNAKTIDKSNKIEKSDRVDRADESSLSVANDLEDQKGKKRSKSSHHVVGLKNDGHLHEARDLDVVKASKLKKQKTNNDLSNEKVLIHKEENTKVEKPVKRKSKVEPAEVDVIDDGETPFVELFVSNTAENPKFSGEKKVGKVFEGSNSVGALATFPAKNKKRACQGKGHALQLPPPAEVGLGGPSAWDSE